MVQCRDSLRVDGVLRRVPRHRRATLTPSPRRLRIQAETGEVGKLSSAFGKGGKFRVQFEGPTDVQPGGRLYLVYKKYAFSSSKALHQDEDCVVPADDEKNKISQILRWIHILCRFSVG